MSSLKVIFCGAAPLSGEVEEQVRQRLRSIVVKQAFGMTEAAPAIHVSVTSKAKKGSVGFLIPSMEARVVDTESGSDLGVGEDGEIIVRGPNLMTGMHTFSHSDCRLSDHYRISEQARRNKDYHH